MIGCRADGLRSLRERYAVVARRACEKPISRCGKRVNRTCCGAPLVNPFPTLLKVTFNRIWHAPAIAPEAPGYGC